MSCGVVKNSILESISATPCRVKSHSGRGSQPPATTMMSLSVIDTGAVPVPAESFALWSLYVAIEGDSQERSFA